MARRKETITQRDFGLGAVRSEAVERDDTALIDASLAEAKNTISTSTGQCEGRPGFVYTRECAADEPFEIDLGAGRVYELALISTGYEIYDENDALVASDYTINWTTLTGKYGTYAFADIVFWVVPDPDSSSVLIGSQYFPIQALVLDGGTWTFGAAVFATGIGGSPSVPYFRYHPDVTIQPSARTGSINITASDTIFSSALVGSYIRYNDRAIELTGYTSTTVMVGTVIEELPPTLKITVASASGFKVGEAVEHSANGGQGIITGISGADITVFVTSGYDGFPASGNLVGPDANQAISASVAAPALADTALWDMQLFSAAKGYPGFAARHKGRLYLCDFPLAPHAYAASAAGYIDDLSMGANDGDGFVETIGTDRGGSLKFIISAEDLLFFTTRGLYYQQTRDGSAVTPTNIGPVSFSRMGCATVRPVAVDDGAVFVDAVGEQVFAAELAGDIYRSWKVRHLTKYHSHIVSAPTRLGATAYGSERPEQFVFCVNADGTVAVCQWDRDEGKLSWRPWETDGTFVSIYQSFGKIYAIFDRTIATVAKRYRERMTYGAYVDCMAGVSVDSAHLQGQSGVAYFGGTTAFATHLNGHTASVYFEGWDYGDLVINASGKPLDADGAVFDYQDYDGIAQVGLSFDTRIVPWARRSVNTQRGTREVKRLIDLSVTVRQSGVFMISDGEFGGYYVAESPDVPPPLRDREYRVTVTGDDSFEEIPILRDRPGPFMLLKLKYRVTV